MSVIPKVRHPLDSNLAPWCVVTILLHKEHTAAAFKSTKRAKRTNEKQSERNQQTVAVVLKPFPLFKYLCITFP